MESLLPVLGTAGLAAVWITTFSPRTERLLRTRAVVLRPTLEGVWTRHPWSYDWTAAFAGFLLCLPAVVASALVLWLVV